MDRVHYAGGSILTGTEIAHALIDYAEALAQAGTAATVVVPTVEEDGSTGESHILVGPSSQMLTVNEPADADDPVDDDWVRTTHTEADRLRRDGAKVTTAAPEQPTYAEQPTFAEQWIADL